MNINILDIICLVFVGYALYRGFKNGLLIEAGSVLSLLVGVWLAFKFGDRFGSWLGFDDATASVAGFILLLVAVVLFIMLACKVLRALLTMTGLGLFDKIGGCIVSVLKTAVVLSLLLGLLAPLNAKSKWVDPKKFEESKTMEYIQPLASKVFPYIKEAKETYMKSLSAEINET